MNVEQAFSLPQAKSLLYKSFRTAIERLFTRGFLTPRDKLLFAIAYYCACRVSEVLALTAEDLAGSVVTLRKCTTKGKIATRTLPEHPKLQGYLAADDPPSGLLFPERNGNKPLTRAAADPQSCLPASED